MSLHDDWAAVAEQFGADAEQVRRDHLISHVRAALARGVSADDLVFIGGTALSRTHLADARLSEDIDLVALAPRTQLAEAIESTIRQGLARSHGRPPGVPPSGQHGPPSLRSSPWATPWASRSNS
jgi:hypothetical protein